MMTDTTMGGPAEFRMIALTAPFITVAALLHAAAFGAEAWDAKALGELLAMPGAQGRLVLEADDHPIGLSICLVVAESAELLTLAVAPDARRRGVASYLVRVFLECAKKKGATNAFLEVAEDNLAAIALYNALGFRFEARRPDYYRREGNILVAAHVLQRSLTQI